MKHLNRRRGKHRAAGRVLTRSQSLTFVPQHCAGQDGSHGCMHSHPGEPALPVWPARAATSW